MNEQAAIETTLASIFALDYPQHLLSVFAVDDGSTDATWERMAFAARRFPNLHAIRFSHNRGKRAAMAAGIRATDAEHHLLRRLRLDARARRAARDHQAVPRPPRGRRDRPRRRAEPRLQRAHAAAAGALLRRLPRDQGLGVDLRRASPAPRAASRPTAATACSRCCRRWETQSFLGREATFGDDRALTNMLLAPPPRRLPVDRALRDQRARTSSRASSSSRRAGRRAGCASR